MKHSIVQKLHKHQSVSSPRGDMESSSSSDWASQNGSRTWRSVTGGTPRGQKGRHLGTNAIDPPHIDRTGTSLLQVKLSETWYGMSSNTNTPRVGTPSMSQAASQASTPGVLPIAQTINAPTPERPFLKSGTPAVRKRQGHFQWSVLKRNAPITASRIRAIEEKADAARDAKNAVPDNLSLSILGTRVPVGAKIAQVLKVTEELCKIEEVEELGQTIKPLLVKTTLKRLFALSAESHPLVYCVTRLVGIMCIPETCRLELIKFGAIQALLGSLWTAGTDAPQQYYIERLALDGLLCLSRRQEGVVALGNNKGAEALLQMLSSRASDPDWMNRLDVLRLLWRSTATKAGRLAAAYGGLLYMILDLNAQHNKTGFLSSEESNLLRALQVELLKWEKANMK